MRTLVDHTELTHCFFFRCLRSFINEDVVPTFESDDSVSRLHYLITKHHLRLVFTYILRNHAPSLLTPIITHQANTIVKRYLEMLSSLMALMDAFHRIPIEPVILKGIPLNMQLYGKQCLREMSDIDILISPGELMTTHQCLIQLGYQLDSQTHPIDLTHQYAFLMSYSSELLYRHPNKIGVLDVKWRVSEIHTHLSHWHSRENTIKLDVFRHTLTILNNEHNFIYLSLHATKHNWEHLKWLLDLAVFYKKMPLCWSHVVALAQEATIIRPLLETTILLERYFDIKTEKIPHSLLDKMVVYMRLYFIQTQWIRGQWKKNKSTERKLFLLNLSLYSRLSHKYHYVTLLFLLRVKSLKYIGRLTKPNRYKMILCGIFRS